MIKNMTFFKGFLAGVLACALFTWVFIYRFPLLLTDKDKISYVLGQQIGEGQSARSIDISPTIFAAAFRDGLTSSSRLSRDEQSEIRQKLQAQRASAQNEQIQRLRAARDMPDENGFFKGPRGIKFKFMSGPKQHAKSAAEIRNAAPPPLTEFKLNIAVLDVNKNDIYNTKARKQPSLNRKDIPRSLFEVITYMGDTEQVMIQVAGPDVREVEKWLSTDLSDGHVLVLERHDLKK